MKKTLIALSIFAFLGSTAIAGVYTAQDNNTVIEMADGGKDKKKKKKKCGDDCAKECCTKEGEKATKSCSKDAKKSCCAKDKKKSDK